MAGFQLEPLSKNNFGSWKIPVRPSPGFDTLSVGFGFNSVLFTYDQWSVLITGIWLEY